jgi:hypothetical protein
VKGAGSVARLGRRREEDRAMAGEATSVRGGGRGAGGVRLLLLVTALGIGVSGVPGLVQRADAIVVCQRKKRVTVRAEKCLKSETVVVDLATVSTRSDDLKSRGAALGIAKVELGFTCPGDPARQLVVSKFSDRIHYGSVTNDPPGAGCRSLDGNQAACQAAFQNGSPFEDNFAAPAAACFYTSHGLCLPCERLGEARAGACVNTCAGPKPTCADAARTVFAGGPNQDACQQYSTQGDCEKAWHLGRLEHLVPATCYWTGSGCNGCGAYHRNRGDCTNTCAPTVTHPACKDAARVTFAGGPNNDACNTYNGDQTNCEKAYHQGGDGIAATCWYDTTANQCNGCGLRHELAGHCDNTCL